MKRAISVRKATLMMATIRNTSVFLFVSGYGSGGKPVLFRSKPVLRKPFLISELGDMINSALSDRAA